MSRPARTISSGSFAMAVLLGVAAAPAAQGLDLNDLAGEAAKVLGSGSAPDSPSGLESSTIADGLKEALEVGASTVVDNLGSPGGFLDSERFRIPLPGVIEQGQTALRLAGLSGIADNLEVEMNRAAEQAVPVAEDIFMEAIRALTFEDAMAIYQGPDDAATRYLERTAGPRISEEMRPIVDEALAGTGAVQTFDQLAGQWADLPLVASLQTNLTDHVLRHANDAVFAYLAEEEQAIRENPAKRTTDLLQTVFGG